MRSVLLTPPRPQSERASSSHDSAYPLALIQAAARVPASKLIDTYADGLSLTQTVLLARGFDLAAIYALSGEITYAQRLAVALRKAYPKMRIGLLTEPSQSYPPSDFDFVFTHAHDQELLRESGYGTLPPSAPLLTALDIYSRDLQIERYHMPYLRYPSIALLTAAENRELSADEVIAEVQKATQRFPQVREIFLDDDSLTRNPKRARHIARGLGELGVVWSSRACPDTPRDLLSDLKQGGLHLLTVDYGAHKTLEASGYAGAVYPLEATRFSRDCRALGIRVHGNFTLGLPGENRQTLRETIRYACKLDVDSIHVGIQTPTPSAELDYEDLMRGLFRMYARFYLRPSPLWRTLKAVWRNPQQRRRRMRLGRDFLRFLWNGPEEVLT